MVVDDEADARDLVQRLLEDAGARVSACDTAQAALQTIQEGFLPDVIVSDVAMPEQDGYDFMKRVRQMKAPMSSIPAAALTALARVADRRRALLAGFQTHLTKPVDPTELVATVASLAGRTGKSYVYVVSSRLHIAAWCSGSSMQCVCRLTEYAVAPFVCPAGTAGVVVTRRSLFPAALWAVPVLALGVTAFAWRSATTTIAARAEERFAFRTDVIESTIRERMRNYEDILRGAAGLFDSSDIVTRSEWQRYMGSIRPGVFDGGVQAMGIALRVAARADRSGRGGRARGADSAARMAVGIQGGVLPGRIRAPVRRRELRALGFDISAESTRRRAMIRAADEGRPILSGRLRLAQEDGLRGEQPGFVLYYPLYRHGMPTSTVGERRAALAGVVFVAFRAARSDGRRLRGAQLGRRVRSFTTGRSTATRRCCIAMATAASLV